MRSKRLNIESEHPLSADERKLMGKLFRKQLVVERIALDRLPGQQQSQSGVSLWLAQPFGANGIEHNPVVIRIGPKAKIDAEQKCYAEFVDPVIGHERAHSLLYETIGSISGIGYSYLHQRATNQPLQTLWQYLLSDRDPDAASRALVTLFRETLAPATRHNRWYNDAHILDQQRPIWFYNQILPPTLVVEVGATSIVQHEQISLVDVLDRADLPDAEQLLGQVITLSTAQCYPRLNIVEQSTQRVRLHLLERTARTMRPNPIQPVAARIDLVGDAETLAQVPTLLQQRRLVGRVQATRAATLQGIYQQHLGDLATRFLSSGDGRLRQGDRALVNPLERYHALLTQPRTLTSSIIHGDMNLWNILLSSVTPDDDRLRAWLIDFEKTGPGGHTVFDAAKLETEYKIHILSQRLHDPDDYIRLERALHQGLIVPDNVDALIGQHEVLQQAYNFIARLRRIMLCDLEGVQIAPVEYYLSLLGYGLAALKYPKLYDHDQGSTAQGGLRQPRAAAAFLSASFAASVIDECVGIRPLEHSYRSLTTHRARQFAKPELVGRDPLLQQIRQQLRQTPSVAIIYGPQGIGRGAVAWTICAEQEQQNKQMWTAGSSAQPIPDVDALIMAILQRLPDDQQQEYIEQMFVQRSRQSSDGLANWIDRTCYQLVDMLERFASPISLLIHLGHTNAQLQSFIGLLTRRVQKTALIVIVDEPFSDDHVDPQVQFEVKPLSLEDVVAYVQMRHLTLDEQGCDYLHRTCFGRPRLLMHFVKEAEQRQHQFGSFQAAIMQLRQSRHIEDLCQDMLQRLPAPSCRVIELGAVLHRYSPEYLDQIEQILATLGLSLGWGTTSELSAAGAAYRQRIRRNIRQLENDVSGNEGDLTPLLRETAMRNLERRSDRRAVYSYLARWGAAQPDVESLIVAGYWVLAEQWREAAQALALYADDPQQTFNSRCPETYALTCSVLKHTSSDDEELLLELAGTCAAYLGQSNAAVGHYRQLMGTLTPDAPNYARIGARLLLALRVVGDQSQRVKTAQALLRKARSDNPLYALCHAALAPADPAHAAQWLGEAITSLEQTRSAWGVDCLLFEEQLISLHEQLAQQEFMQQHYDEALDILKKARSAATRVLSNKLLTARLDSVMGVVYSYRGLYDDLETAEQRLTAAYEVRAEQGDRVGQLYTAQNLAILRQNLAQSRSDWDAAEDFYCRVQGIARQVDIAKAWMLGANQMELLIRRGDVVQAQSHFEEALASADQDEQTRMLLLINRAKLGLWQRNREECQSYLHRAASETDLSQSPADQLEWVQLCLQAHLLLELPLADTLAAYVEAAEVQPEEQPLDGGEWLFAAGLLAYAQGDQQRAMPALAKSREIWNDVKFRYHAGHVALWETLLYLRGGNSDAAQAHLQIAAPLLKPFGDTPAWDWLVELKQQIEAVS